MNDSREPERPVGMGYLSLLFGGVWSLACGVGCSNGATDAAAHDTNAQHTTATDTSAPSSATSVPQATSAVEPDNGETGATTNSTTGQGAATGATGAGSSSAQVSAGGVATMPDVTTSSDATSGSDSNDMLTSSAADSSGNDPTTLPIDVVTLTNSTVAFSHYPIEVNNDGVWSGPESPGTQAETTTYDTVVLENGSLKVTLLPSYGGRILSLLHKPTNREFLYQNPIGTPYLMQQDIFYYDYLVIMGGIFPSFPEPEHGKYWNQPYDFEVVTETDAAVTVRMSRVDDRDLVPGVPERYDVGRTDVRVALEVTLRAGRSNLELATTLTNTRSEPVPKFEYWTITTLAPGSTPGATSIPLNTRILAQMDEVHLYESSWSWFGEAEERIDGEVFKWQNLAEFDNWVDQGTAFANPSYSANWSGLMNADNNMGIVCVTDPSKVVGLKLWTFGKQSLEADVADSSQWLRPTIEMWHGVTPEFWMRGSLAANEVRSWTDHYLPTLGLSDITAANEYGAVQLSSSRDATEAALKFAASLSIPNQRVHAILRVGDTKVGERDLDVSSTEPSTFSVTVPNAMAAAGTVFEAEILRGDVSILTGSITLPE